MGENKKEKISLIITIVTLLILVVGATYAYFAAQTDGTTSTKVDITAESVDSLTFSTGNPINVSLTLDNFSEGAGNKIGKTTATASLIAGKNSNPSYNYLIYFDIEENGFEYTTKDRKAELVLKVTKPDGTELKEINGFNYVTEGEVSGFDITNKSGNIIIAADNITTNSEIEKTWSIEVIFVNLESNQIANAGKKLKAKLMIEQEIIHIASTYNNINGSSGLANINCDGSTATYNPQYKRVEITEFNKNNTVCNLEYLDPSEKTNLNSYIIELNGTTQGTGQVVNENGYRYEGKNPNNYIWFNNEMWRIIGVIPTKTDNGVENLVKIIRLNSLGDMAYDAKNTNYIGIWGENTLYKLLNEYYLGQKNGTNTEYCYSYGNEVKQKCDYSVIGIPKNEKAGELIKEVYWNTGTTQYDSSASNAYQMELQKQTVKAYIGLMSASDYGYSAINHEETSLKNYGESLEMWLYNEYNVWTNSQSIDNENQVLINYTKRVITRDSNESEAVYPVVYLKENVYVVSGNGSYNNPYIIGI